MHKSILYSIIFFLGSCSIDENCGEIIDMVYEDNKHILVIRFDNGSTNNDNDFGGELVSDINVDEEVFQNFSEGDNYCIK